MQENRVRIIESYLIPPQEGKLIQDFYGQALRLALVGFVRPEQKFSGLPALVERIGKDVRIASDTCHRIFDLKEPGTEKHRALAMDYLGSPDTGGAEEINSFKYLTV